MVSGDSFVLAATAVSFGLLLHGLLRCADHAVRGRLSEPGLLVMAGVLAIVLVIAGWLTLVDRFRPGLGGPGATAALIGLLIGRVVPRPDARFRFRGGGDVWSDGDGGDGGH